MFKRNSHFFYDKNLLYLVYKEGIEGLKKERKYTIHKILIVKRPSKKFLRRNETFDVNIKLTAKIYSEFQKHQRKITFLVA